VNQAAAGSSHAIFSVDSQHLFIDNNDIEEFYENGISVLAFNTTGHTIVSNNKLTGKDDTVTDHPQTGITIEGGKLTVKSNSIVLENGRIGTTDDVEGINVLDSEDAEITGNKINLNCKTAASQNCPRYNGIRIFNVDNSDISNNQITAVEETDSENAPLFRPIIASGSCNHNTISNNKIKVDGMDVAAVLKAMYISGLNDSTIEANNIYFDNVDTTFDHIGIWLDASDRNTVNGNRINGVNKGR
ncbi:unnamed protein product, partial [marine sediment metagenome]